MAPAEFAAWGIGAFLTGILLAGAHAAPVYFFALPLLGLGAGWLYGHNWKILLLIILALAGGILYYRTFFNFRALGINVSPVNGGYAGIVSSEPRNGKNSVYAEVELVKPQSGRMRVIFPAGSGLHYGDKIIFRGSLEIPPGEREAPVIMVRQTEILAAGQGNPLLSALFAVKNYFLEPVRRNLPAEPGAFLEGLLLGYKNDFSANLQEAMRNSGTTHLVALSGYNVTIVILAIHALLLGRVTRRLAFWAVGGLILLFALMTGAEPSIIRASVMGLLLLTAREIGRIPSYGLLTLWAAFVMCLWNPGVMFTAGFVLSFASFLGIGYLGPAITFAFRIKEDRAWLAGVITTLSAQLATLPFLIIFFGQFTWVGLLANMLILPVIPFTMGLGFAFMGLSAVLPPLSGIFAWFLRAPLVYVLGVIRGAADWSRPLSISLPSSIVLAYIAVLAVFSLHYGRKRAH